MHFLHRGSFQVRLPRLSLYIILSFIGFAALAPRWVSAGTPLPPSPSLSQKNVLILHSHEANAPLFLETDKGLAGTLSSGGVSSQHQFFESLDFRRNQGSEQKNLLAKVMAARYRHRRPDAVVTMYPEALEFVLKDCKDLFSRTPILALYLPRDFEVPATDRPIVGHFPTFDISGTLEMALKLVPGAKRVYVVAGTHQVDKELEDQTRVISKKWQGKIEFLYLSHMPFDDILLTLSRAPSDSIVLFLSLSRDAAGNSRISPEAAERLSEVSSVPIFGVLDVALRHGIAGGSLANFQRVGSKAGEFVLDILRGDRTPENMPSVLDVPSVPMFDWRQLRHWHLSESALPKGSIVINKQFSLWDFRYYTAGVLLLCLVETALVVFLVLQMRRRRTVEQGLRQKTEELDRFFDVSLDSLCIANTDGRFLRLNPAWERILGYTRDELAEKPFLDFVHPDDMARTLGAVDNLASQQKVTSFENRYRAKDGAYRWLQWAAAPAGKLIYAAARDVTERKRTDEALRESEERFRQVAENVGDFIWEVDTDGLYTYTSPSVERILGFRPDELIGKVHFYDLFAPEVHEELKTAALKVFASGESFRAFPNVNIGKGGRMVHLETSGSPVLDMAGNLFGYRGADTDVTNRREAERMLRNSEEKFRQFFSHIPEYCYIISPGGIVIDVNDQALKTLGYERDELVGKPIAMIYAPESLGQGEELLRQFRQRGEIDNEELTIITKDGERRVVLLNAGAVRDGDGTILYSASVQTDITDRRRVEADTFVARREMLRLERLLRMGELSASLAHELNQPLTSILSNARAATRLLEAGRLGADELKEILNDIAHDDKRAGDVVRSLRSMVRVEEGEMEVVPVAELVNEAVTLFNSEAIIRNIKVDVDMGTFPSLAKVNRVQIQQVIINLLMNAAEAMESEAVTERKLIIGAHRSEQTVRVSVRDFGIGIDGSETKRLFEPFFTTKTSGLGMGLSLSRSIIEAHGGHIWAENNPDKGATFFFDLPVRDEQPGDG